MPEDRIIGLDLSMDGGGGKTVLVPPRLTREKLEEAKYTLEDCKQLTAGLHQSMTEVITYAWSKGFHVELTEFIMQLKELPRGGGGH